MTDADRLSALEAGARFSADELAVACAVVEVPPLPGLAGSAFVRLPEDEQRQAFGSALRSLVAHEVVSDDDGRAALPRDVHALVAAAGKPRVRAAVRRTHRDSVVWSHFCFCGELGVQHRWNLIDVHELVPFPAGEFAARLSEFAGLDRQPAQDVPGFEITVAAFVEALTHLSVLTPCHPQLLTLLRLCVARVFGGAATMPSLTTEEPARPHSASSRAQGGASSRARDHPPHLRSGAPNVLGVALDGDVCLP